MYFHRKLLLFITATSLIGESLSLCGVDDSFVSPGNDGLAYKIQHWRSRYVSHRFFCESNGLGEIDQEIF